MPAVGSEKLKVPCNSLRHGSLKVVALKGGRPAVSLEIHITQVRITSTDHGLR